MAKFASVSRVIDPTLHQISPRKPSIPSTALGGGGDKVLRVAYTSLLRYLIPQKTHLPRLEPLGYMSGPSLKRPRSSNPPSPSTSNSSKRAASEDPLGSMSENGRSDTNGLLSPTMQAMAAGSSPLRKESDNDEAGWVKKTEDFHLSSSDGREPNGDAEEVEEEEEDENVSENFKEQYPEILGECGRGEDVKVKNPDNECPFAAAMSPPFKAWEKYYIIPASLLENLKILAMGESGKTSASPLNVEMDVTPLLDDPQDEVDSRLWQIDTVKSGDKTELGTSMHQEPIWGVKPGLVENEDFVFISEEGWKKWIEW